MALTNSIPGDFDYPWQRKRVAIIAIKFFLVRERKFSRNVFTTVAVIVGN